MQRTTRNTALTTLVVVALMITAQIAIADNLDTVETGTFSVPVGSTVAIHYYLKKTGPDCDAGATSSTDVDVVLTVPAGLSASETSFILTDCGSSNSHEVVFTGLTASETHYVVSAAASGGASGSDLNTAPSSIKITVTSGSPPADTTPPVVVAPDDMLVEATGPGGAFVTIPSASWTDNVDGSGTDAVCLPGSSTFPLGSTDIICSKSDAAGNIGTDGFSVTVVDTTAPVVLAPPPLVVEGNTLNGANVGALGASWTDLVDGAGTTPCAPGGGFFPLGTTIVGCSYTDAAGNFGAAATSVTVIDTTAPVVTPPSPIVVEATGPSGAPVTIPDGVAFDVVSGSLPAPCLPGTGTFPIGSTLVTCTAIDGSANLGSAGFTVLVQDTTPPTVIAPPPLVVEGNLLGGALVGVPDASWTDVVDGEGTTPCTPGSGYFLLGTTPIACSYTDAAGNTGGAVSHVTVVDTKAPVVTAPPPMIAEATSPAGAVVTVPPGTALDIVWGPLAAPCPPGTATFPLGTTVVVCSATDGSGNTGNAATTVTVVDTTAPVGTATLVGGVLGLNGWYVVAPTLDYVCTDAVGVIDCPADLAPTSNGDFAATNIAIHDAAGNEGTISVPAYKVDTAAPSVAPATWSFGPFYWGFVPALPACVASDALSGLASCTAVDVGPAVGAHTVTYTATDNAGNQDTAILAYTILAWTGTGFYSPVDMGGVVNTIRGGSTVPVKFNVWAGSTEIVNPASIRMSVVSHPCASNSPMDEVEVTTSGSTSLRYDTTAGQFIFNWKTPNTRNTCYTLTMTSDGGATLAAEFKTKA